MSYKISCNGSNARLSLQTGSVGPRKTQSLTELSLMEAVMPLLPTHKFNALALANVGEAGPLFLLSQMTDQPKQIMSPLSPAVSSHLTALTVFKITGEERLDYTRLKFLLRATSQLKIFTFEHFGRVDSEEQQDKTIVSLPMLEKLTMKGPSPIAYKLLDSLSAPDVYQLKLLSWKTDDEPDLYYLFVSDDDDVNLKPESVSRLSRITAPLTFQWLQHFTLNLTFLWYELDPRGCFTWLPAPTDRSDRPLVISISHSSDLPMLRRWKQCAVNRQIFQHYKELQRYRKIDESSSRLDAFLRWQANVPIGTVSSKLESEMRRVRAE
ncbi:hypothetical protein BJ138DRAFT_1102597 [Hygrophoropsis aurantiaca]|uniref:Uncharacterized protein n=1 Tax=Hygrophoropsis aurantiaca TaxID=72124 RepID=A0ACB8A900_9AGAM|nr:hypothetical protein BJ138DRAFT_1102597 [Hygrophoropsis aurantiaca]